MRIDTTYAELDFQQVRRSHRRRRSWNRRLVDTIDMLCYAKVWATICNSSWKTGTIARTELHYTALREMLIKVQQVRKLQ